jgi:hypothetical protein
MSAPNIAIVTTLRDAGLVLDSFIQYHLAIGFDHLFLFFDEPNDPSLDKARQYEGVTAIENDQSLRRQWEASRLFALDSGLRRFVDKEVMGRQELNAGLAVQMAVEKQIDWLLHIDVDELFYSPAQTPKEHFDSLSRRAVQQVTYVNYEAIPQRTDVRDYFKEIVLFKIAPQALTGGTFSAEQAEILRSIPKLPDNFFLFYGNGKSAARVSEYLLPAGVHKFRVEAGGPEGEISTDPIILHYACCGFEHFWRKYKTLGAFADKWFDSIDIAETGNVFHLEARGVVSRNNREAALEFYKERVVIDDAESIARLVESGLCCFVEDPSRLLQSTPDAASNLRHNHRLNFE